ncbi:hypothetical protein [Erwinia aphidicola]|uniref:Restriction alleviation protein Lar n=1 Tax=Erwinia aphidicola TaxID=68334 RepID=A0ABU8DL70_ERWAP
MNTQQLKERYAAPEIPKCRVCGGELTVQRAGGGPTVWGCSGMVDDPTGERNWIYAEGRSFADEHYERSRWSDYRQGGDADVIELIERLEAAEKLAEFRSNSINSIDKLVADRDKRIAELEAAERERDELRAEQAEHDEQIARMESKFSLAKRALDSKTARCEKAETELRRRDAAAGEPVDNPVLGYADSYRRMASRGVENVPIWSVITDLERNIAPLYTGAPPAVLSPEKITEIMQDAWNEFCDDTGCYPDDFEYQNEKLFFDAGRWAMLVAERISSLGAQQQKVVALPDHKFRECVNGLLEEAIAYAGTQQLRARLSSRLSNFVKTQRATGVKWEVKK